MNKMITINPDLLLKLKIEKVSKMTNESISKLILDAINHFVETQGYNNPANQLSSRESIK